MKKISLSLTVLSLVLFTPSVIAAPAKTTSEPTDAQIQIFAKLLCDRLQNGERFDSAMFRAIGDLADNDESFALMITNDISGFDKLGGDAYKLCPGAMGQSMEKMPPQVRAAYFK